MELLEHPILASVPASERGNLSLRKKVYAKDDLVFSSGQQMDNVCFVLEGSIRLVHRDLSLGIRRVVDTVDEGEILGGTPGQGIPICRHDALASDNCVTVYMTFTLFDALLDRCPGLSKALLRFNSVKQRILEERVVETSELDVSQVVFDEMLIAGLPGKYMLAKKVLPLAMEGGTLSVACATQDTAGIEADMRRLLSAHRVETFYITPKMFEKVYRDAVQKHERIASDMEETTWYEGVRRKDYFVEFETGHDVLADSLKEDAEVEGTAVVKLLNKIVGEAMDLGASDVHFEPYPRSMDVRFRLDGELLLRPEKVGAGFLNAVLSRIKVLSGMDISERRKPQDGRMTITLSSKTVDVRVSSVATRYGEKIVLRILDPSSMLIDLDTLVLGDEVRKGIKWMLDQPSGMILIAGPTGSGKTTTVYSMLLRKRKEPVNIMSIEDPIEYMLRGVSQVQRNTFVGLDFPNAVRSFLRQDPDIIVVGETRDPETAKAALEAGLTGHLVISTVHANNVFSTAYRLREMGMEPFVIANSLIGIISQRLVRRICPRCSQSSKYHRNLVEPMNLPNLPPPSGDYYVFQKGRGCISCNFRGYRGRVAVFETLKIVDGLKPVIAADVAFKELEEQSVNHGAYVSMRGYASLLLNSGSTTPEEISRILFIEGR
jgi:type IV pilus assembly protein PilB